jgi:pimeloyl-ACP methyl ester carboxylesterase
MRGEFLDLSGARVYYYAAGTRGAGVPVVFLHGFATSGHLWSDVVPLMPAGHRLVIVDLLGHGRSDRPLHRVVDIRAQADRVIELFDELRIRHACVVGHGLGGGIAQSIAMRHASRVSHLALVASVAFDAWPARSVRIARAALSLAGILPPELVVGMVRRGLERGYDDPVRAAHSLDAYLRPFAGPEGRDALVAHLRALRNRETIKIGRKLAKLNVPTAIIWGAADRILPLEVGRRLQAAIPGATLTTVPGAGHMLPEEAPRQTADAIATLLARA